MSSYASAQNLRISKQFARRGRAVDIEGSGLDDLSAGARPRHDGAFLLSLLFLSSGLRVFLNFRRGFDNFLGQLELYTFAVYSITDRLKIL